MDPSPPSDDSPTSEPAPPRPQEQLLIEVLAELAGGVILCTTAGLAQFATTAATQFPSSSIICWFLDMHHAEQARQHATANDNLSSNLTLHCAADLPELAADVVALPLSANGEAELARDLMQTGHTRLVDGGLLAVSTDNPRDTWLHQELAKLCPRVERRPSPRGVVYLARKAGPLRKLKNFGCEFAFRDGGRLIRAVSRPGVFAHRRIDAGARQVLNFMRIEPGQRVLDIGCGSGVLSLAAAFRATNVQVHAVDSNARAVACTAAGAALNGLTTIGTQLNADGEFAGANTYQLALANPPYYANFRIARHFVVSALRALEAGGRIVVVGKHPEWYAENLPLWYDDVEIFESKGYYLATGLASQRSSRPQGGG